jgi:hypothetical protein
MSVVSIAHRPQGGLVSDHRSQWVMREEKVEMCQNPDKIEDTESPMRVGTDRLTFNVHGGIDRCDKALLKYDLECSGRRGGARLSGVGEEMYWASTIGRSVASA